MRHLSVAVCLILLATTLSAATFDKLPTDAELLDRAQLVVVATVKRATAREAADRVILTDYELRVEEVLKGHAPASLVVSEVGGFANGHGMEIAGSATYRPGMRVLVFLRQRADGTYYTASMALGKYRFHKDLLVRDAEGIEMLDGDPYHARDAAAFLDQLRSGKTSRTKIAATELKRPDPILETNAVASAYVLSSGGPKRWKDCETGCTIGFIINNGAHPVTNPVGGLHNAYAAWTDHANSFVELQSSSVGADSGWTNDDENDIVFNWNGSNPHSSCEGAKGCGIVYFNGPPFTHVFRSETFNDVVAADVLIHSSITNQSAFESVLTHELGHALAFRHSNEGTPFSTAGVMNSTVPTGVGANLGPWEEEALTAVYGPGVACVPITINSVAGGGTVPFGQSAVLSVNASGDFPRQHQWYAGTSGDISNPIAGETGPSFVTPAITETKQYWVKVGNGCPSFQHSATITVTPESCDEPLILTESQSLRINPNTHTMLQVTATGTPPLTYRWYRSNTVGDTSVQVGTQANFTTPNLTTTTSYWARVSNACGHDDTALITVTVGTACVPPAIVSQSPNIGVLKGDGATLIVSTSGDSPFTHQWYEGESGDVTKPISGATNSAYSAGPFNNPGTFKFWVRVTNQCGHVNSATITITVACPQIFVPLASVPAITHFTAGYNVSWTGDVSVTPTFELQEATNPEFTANVQTFTVNGALAKAIPAKLTITADTRFYYRVRGFSVCTGQPTAYSNTASIVATRPLPADSDSFSFSIPEGTTQSFTQDLLVPGFGDTATNNDTFSITTDVPWLTVFPTNGALSAGGTTVQLTVNPPGLEVGTTTGTIQLTRTNAVAANGVATHSGPVIGSFPFSVSLVTPVSPDPRDGNPPPGTLIIPAVAHAQGVGSPFRSDVRIVNVSFADIDYDISYTPSQLDGTQTGKKTTVTVRAGDVLALDDIVASWYGAGMLGEGGIGTIEIRPLTSGNPFDTFASSRTYALVGGGTLGQFIPALRLNQFIGPFAQDSLSRISLQQLANNTDYRTNLGFVEGSGAPVSLLARLVDGNNNILQQTTLELSPFGHLQRPLTNLFGNVNLTDGRMEVEVLSPGGKVSAYASVLNNLTNDPLMVFPVQPQRTTAERYVLAGIAEFNAASNFHSDMRIYNAGQTAVTATLNYYPQGSDVPHPNAPPAQITLNPGQVRAIDDVLPTLWPGVTGGGSVIATTSGPSSLVLTAQTFSLQENGGTKGQFIPGVTFREAIGVGDRPLEVLQLEQSDQYRSNVGFVEVTGKPAIIEVTAHEPDTKTAVNVAISLKANEYVQYARLLSSMGLGTVYNGRVSVKVLGGEGRVYAYGSTVDNRTEDPTYVPAQ